MDLEIQKMIDESIDQATRSIWDKIHSLTDRINDIQRQVHDQSDRTSNLDWDIREVKNGLESVQRDIQHL